jgi:peptide/nickel transport system permease protein
MLYWAIAWGSIRTGAWWAFLPPTIMLSIVSFSLLLLQSSLDEVFNPRLRRGKLSRRKGTALQATGSPLAAASPQAGEAPVLETPTTAGAGSAPAGGGRRG